MVVQMIHEAGGIDPDATTHPTLLPLFLNVDKPTTTTTANETSESSGYDIKSDGIALRTAAPPTHEAAKMALRQMTAHRPDVVS